MAGRPNLNTALSTPVNMTQGTIRDKIIDFKKDFMSELSGLMLQLTDADTEYIEWDGMQLLKGGAAFSFKLDEWMDTSESVLSQMVANYKILMDMDKKLDNIAVS